METRIRVSCFNNYVGLPNDEFLLIHGYSGAVDLAGRDTVSRLREGDTNLPADEIDQLLRRGYVTRRTPEEEQEFAARIFRHKYARKIAKRSFVFLLSYNCNFRCTYCFQREAQNRGDALLQKVMTPDVLESAFRFIDGFDEPAHLTLYGGEPFLASNAAALEHFMRLARERGHRIGAVTNGFQLDRFLPLLGAGGVETIQVTVDGPPSIHDTRRPTAGGGGTFAKILPNLRKALERDTRVMLRVNCDPENTPALPELVAHVKEAGLFAFPKFQWNVFPVVNLMNDPSVVTFGHTELLDAVDALDGVKAPGIVHQGLRRQLTTALENGTAYGYEPIACSAYKHMFVLDPFGRLYACWDAVAEEEACVGTYHPNVKIDEERLDVWRTRPDVVLDVCAGCPYLLFCGGGCLEKAMSACGTAKAPDCSDFDTLFQVHMRAAFAEFAARAMPDSSG